jgi:hypothetical protein
VKAQLEGKTCPPPPPRRPASLPGVQPKVSGRPDRDHAFENVDQPGERQPPRPSTRPALVPPVLPLPSRAVLAGAPAHQVVARCQAAQQ